MMVPISGIIHDDPPRYDDILPSYDQAMSSDLPEYDQLKYASNLVV